jgi:hypothetical protein
LAKGRVASYIPALAVALVDGGTFSVGDDL